MSHTPFSFLYEVYGYVDLQIEFRGRSPLMNFFLQASLIEGEIMISRSFHTSPVVYMKLTQRHFQSKSVGDLSTATEIEIAG